MNEYVMKESSLRQWSMLYIATKTEDHYPDNMIDNNERKTKLLYSQIDILYFINFVGIILYCLSFFSVTIANKLNVCISYMLEILAVLHTLLHSQQLKWSNPDVIHLMTLAVTLLQNWLKTSAVSPKSMFLYPFRVVHKHFFSLSGTHMSGQFGLSCLMSHFYPTWEKQLSMTVQSRLKKYKMSIILRMICQFTVE